MEEEYDLKSDLISLGFEEDEIQELLEYATNDIDAKELKRKIEFLISLRLRNETILMIISENPLFITTELEDMMNTVDYLKNKLNENDVSVVLGLEPYAITTSREYFERNEHEIGKYVGEEGIKEELLSNTELFTFEPEFLAERIDYLISKGHKDHLEDIFVDDIDFFYLDDDEIDDYEFRYEMR